ncbi:MAG: thioredoxin domain-containing protein [Desulfosalsimonadaceae bacterium]
MNTQNAQIIKCPACGASNRISADKIEKAPKCGKCHAALPAPKAAGGGKPYTLRCIGCGAKNRVPANKIESGPKCGKCKAVLKTEELFVPQPVMVTDRNFEDRVLKSPLPVLLFAWATWCPTCVAVSPIIDEFAAEAKTKVRVGKLNVDQNRMLASKYKILSVPFIFIFDNGKLKESMPGGLKKHELMMQMAHYL